ncbi:HNH endonuclease [Sulfobacillus thermosulfidooxidans]|uniref:HNH endonuclease n=1 Tax=Sulfobacillus thermosulfidooxidans TaxID=28034 RepID=UPI0006B6228F|nr:HNH endonuclease [Sulfobacillus thermosulfidooxidans]
MDCIICLTPLSNNGTIEHVIPDSIGGTLTFQDVCSSCNSLLGTHVDSLLLNNFFVATARARLRIPGKGGDVPNPFDYVILTDDHGNQYRYHLDPEGNPDRLELIPRKEANS